MKHAHPERLIAIPLLRYVRDERPTEAEFVARSGGPAGHHFHCLREHGVIVVDAGHVRLNRRHLSPDGSQFVWGTCACYLDENTVRVVRWADGGPPVYADEP